MPYNYHLTLYSIGYFLDHDIIFYFQTTLQKFKKKFNYVLNTFENIMENGVFCSIRANAPFSIIFSNTYYFKGIQKAL